MCLNHLSAALVSECCQYLGHPGAKLGSAAAEQQEELDEIQQPGRVVFQRGGGQICENGSLSTGGEKSPNWQLLHYFHGLALKRRSEKPFFTFHSGPFVIVLPEGFRSWAGGDPTKQDKVTDCAGRSLAYVSAGCQLALLVDIKGVIHFIYSRFLFFSLQDLRTDTPSPTLVFPLDGELQP